MPDKVRDRSEQFSIAIESHFVAAKRDTGGDRGGQGQSGASRSKDTHNYFLNVSILCLIWKLFNCFSQPRV